MATIERFEDIKAWQEARALTKQIYLLTNTGDIARDFGLRDQLRRSAVSILSNIAEGTDQQNAQRLHPLPSDLTRARYQEPLTFDFGP